MKHLMKWCLALCCTALLQGCAIGPKQVWQKFTFNGREDGWFESIDLLAYAYGDGDRMLMDDIAKPRGMMQRDGESLLLGKNINGPMPVGEFLFVKWRIRATGQIMEERVDLRNRLPHDMTDHGLTFVIEGAQLYVYVITPKPKAVYGMPPIEKTWHSYARQTYEIFPQLKKP
jgi:hypothetical protein